MTERLTRAQRKKIENETHQKLDLDHLAEINVHKLIEEAEHKHTEEPSVEVQTETPNVEEQPEEPVEEPTETPVQTKNPVTEANADESDSESASSSDEEDDSEDDSSEEEESSDEDDVDLDDLLNKAQSALQEKSADIILEDADTEEINTKLSKMDTGISLNEELYLKKVNGRTKLVPDAVALVDDNTKANSKATIVLKESKEDKQPLTRKERQAEREKTSGKAWFDMPRAEMTDEVKRDLQVLKMRHILDRKRHYKKMGKTPDPKYFQVGTIIESPTEFFSARINKKDRKQTIVDELMASDESKQYYKRKYNEVYDRTTSGGKKHYKKLKAQRQWAK